MQKTRKRIERKAVPVYINGHIVKHPVSTEQRIKQLRIELNLPESKSERLTRQLSAALRNPEIILNSFKN